MLWQAEGLVSLRCVFPETKFVELLLFWTDDAHQFWEIGCVDAEQHVAVRMLGVWAHIGNKRHECFLMSKTPRLCCH